MSMEKSRPPRPEGCLTAFIRVPVRIVVLVVVVPVRMVWDVLVVCGRFAERVLLRPLARWLGRLGRQVAAPLVWLGRNVLAPLFRGLAVAAGWLGRAVFVWPWVGLWRYLLVPAVRYGIVVPALWAYRWILTPIGRTLTLLADALWRYGVLPVVRYAFALPALWLYGTVLAPLGRGLARVLAGLGRGLAWLFTGLGRGLAWVGRAVFVWPWVALWRYVVVPVVHYGVVAPARWLWRRVIVPVCREIGDAFQVCWRIAGFVSRAVGRALRWVAWQLVGRPAVWIYRSVCVPVGHWVRDQVWAPARKAALEAGRAARAALASARATVRQARRDAWHALVGGARPTEPGEPVAASTRTLGSTTTASGVAPAPEISPFRRG
ncbi:hypothetical protein [Streptomyces sp. NPDC093600]|uniref:hypothetical protein n=1 Tax=Streptomyces sp. NPDC093600 TaxID=3366047 RepID=UPI00382B3F04